MSEPESSPRTADQPMAFDSEELVRGALWAWLAFTVLMLVTFVIAGYVGTIVSPPGVGSIGAAGYTFIIAFGYAALIGGSVSFGVMLVLWPLFWLVGRSLRRVRPIGSHVAVYALIGAVMGVVAVTLVAPDGRMLGSMLLPITVAITTTSVVFGWLRASRHARRELRAQDPRSPLGLERAFDSEASPY